MDIKTSKLKKFIAKEHRRLLKYYGGGESEDKRTLARTVKMTEEVGELCNEILVFNTTQRKSREKDEDGLKNEFADVIITTLLLAENIGINVWSGLNKKIKKIEQRYKEKYGRK